MIPVIDKQKFSADMNQMKENIGQRREDLEQHRKNLNQQLEAKRREMRDQFVRDNLMTDEFVDFMTENMAPYENLMTYYRCAIMEIETKFKVLNEEFSLQYDRNPIESIKTRVKSVNSLMKKVNRMGIPLTMEAIEANINDIAGVRVICSFLDDIYLLEECLLEQDDVNLLVRKDYIKNPKESGYRSLHLIVEVPIFLKNEKRSVKVEVQFRTIAMDFWASVEHKLRYKKDIPAEKEERLTKELFNCAELSASLDQRMQAIKDDLAVTMADE